MEIPTQFNLETDRLLLRPFDKADAASVQRLAGDPKVASTTLSIPHPYPNGAAEAWIELHANWFATRRAVVYAITSKKSGELLGCIDLSINLAHRKAEMGYWVGVDFWNQGYATEAARALSVYAFGSLGLHRLTARHRVENPASGAVMMKVGFRREGLLAQDLYKDGSYMDLVVYGMLESYLP